MRDSTKMIMGIFGLVMIIVIPIMIVASITFSIPDTFVEDGIVTNKRVESGSFMKSEDYIVEINNNTEYIVGKEVYTSISVGNFVKVYQTFGGSIKIIRSEAP